MKLIKVLFIFSFILLWGKGIEINFKNLSLQDFIKMISKITNKNVLVTNNINGRVNFISVKPVSKEQLWNILLAVLRSKGYTIIENNGFLEVISLSKAVKLASLSNKTSIPQMKTSIIYLKYISPQNIKSQVSNFLSNYGKIIIPKKSNFIIITDFPQNIKKIKRFVRLIDYKEKKEVKFIKLSYSSSSVVAKQIKQIVSNIIPNNAYNIYSNDVANSLIVISSHKYMNYFINLIKKLDTKRQTLSTKIIHLKNTDTVAMSKVISNILKERYKAKNKVSVTTDKEDNSLILVGMPNQLDLIAGIIKALDVPKKQVYVKVRILELSNSKVSQMGMKLGILGGSATNSGLYTLSANLGGPALAFSPASLGLSVPTIKEGVALGATLDLLVTTGAAKKLSEPSILCVNNLPSTIYVGKTVSVITQSTVGATSTDLTKNNYSRQDIGLKMDIKPRIDVDNKVAIHLKGIIEDILPGSQVGLPITSKREIDTNAIVKNGQSIIVGGLIRDNSDITVDKVPLLGDIPVLGALFRHKNKNDDKTTIVMVLTPYIVNNSDDLSKLRNVLVKLNEVEYSFVKKLMKKLKASK